MEEKNENKEKEISLSSLASILHGLKYDLKEEMVAMISAKKFDEQAVIEKAKEIRNVELHASACYSIGNFRFQVEENKS